MLSSQQKMPCCMNTVLTPFSKKWNRKKTPNQTKTKPKVILEVICANPQGGRSLYSADEAEKNRCNLITEVCYEYL